MLHDTYTVVIGRVHPDDGGGYVAMAPDLPICIGDGDTPDAAVRDLDDAIDEWVEDAHSRGRLVPEAGSAMATLLKSAEYRHWTARDARSDPGFLSRLLPDVDTSQFTELEIRPEGQAGARHAAFAT